MSDAPLGWACSHIGVSCTGDPVLRQKPDGTWEVRVGVALLGSRNMSEEQIAACHDDPFNPEFHDNYACGIGPTQEAALAALEADLKDMANSLFADC